MFADESISRIGRYRGIGRNGRQTQLLALLLAARLRKPWAIVWGTLVATLANHAVAEALNSWVTTFLGPTGLRLVSGVSFIAMALCMKIPDKLDNGDAAIAPLFGILATTLKMFFLAEMGDETQIASVMPAASYDAFLWVVAGTTLGMVLANAPVVWLGERITRYVPLRAVHMTAALVSLALGLFAPLG